MIACAAMIAQGRSSDAGQLQGSHVDDDLAAPLLLQIPDFGPITEPSPERATLCKTPRHLLRLRPARSSIHRRSRKEIHGPDHGQAYTRIVALIIAIGMLAACEVGKWMGRRFLDNAHAKPSKFDDASMALLGLLLAFTFGSSISKHEQRVSAVVTDSNAIGDFYTCATLLKEPTPTRLQAVIRQYVQLRLDLARHGRTESDLETALAQSDQMLGQMTQLVGQALNEGTPIAVSLTNSLNAVASNQASRLASHRDRLHPAIIFLLFASAVITTLLIGREQASSDNYEFAGTLFFIALISLAIYVTLDLNLPQSGLIRVSQEPMLRLYDSIKQ
jgi:hypothetical protein